MEYSEENIVNILKDINEMVVSLDRMDSVYHEFSEEEWKDELINYLISKKVSQKLSKIRTVLSEPFSNDLGDDDMSFLEREMQDVLERTIS